MTASRFQGRPRSKFSRKKWKIKINELKMRHFLLTLIIIAAGFALYGQPGNCNCADEVEATWLDSKLTCLVLPVLLEQTPDDGLFGQWRYGRIILNSGEVISGEIIHYDGLNDQLIINSKNPAFKLAVEKYTIQGFDMGTPDSDPIFMFRRIKVKEKLSTEFQDLFLQVLNQGKNTLYVYRKLTKSVTLNKIVRNYVYYIKKEDGSLVSFVKPSRKTIIKLFPEKADFYLVRLRRMHNHVRNEEQLINAVDVLNSL